jgi:hypothetical protein
LQNGFLFPQMKPGRNDPCHCGSGQKYKRCHLDQDRRTEQVARQLDDSVDLTAYVLAMARKESSHLAAYTAPAQELTEQLRSGLGDGLKGKAAADVLAAHLSEVEGRIAEIASKHSRGYWLHLIRRLPPLPFGGESAWTLTLCRRVLTLGVPKYGRPAVMVGEFKQVESAFGGRQIVDGLNPPGAITVLSLDYLAYEYVSATQAYRRVGKGARLEVAGGDFRAVSSSDGLDELIADVDRRNEEYGEPVASPWVGSEDFGTELKAGGRIPLVAIVAEPNFGLRPSEEISSHKIRLGDPANFLIAVTKIDEYRAAFQSLRDEFQDAFGVEPDVLIATICSLSIRLLREIQESPAVESQILRVGYLMVPDENWTNVVDEPVNRVVNISTPRRSEGDMAAPVADALPRAALVSTAAASASFIPEAHTVRRFRVDDVAEDDVIDVGRRDQARTIAAERGGRAEL